MISNKKQFQERQHSSKDAFVLFLIFGIQNISV